MFLPGFFASAFIFICWATPTFGAPRLLSDEVDALKQIAKTLGKTNWNFNVDPCSGQSGWTTPNATKDDMVSNVNCTCSFNNSCHIVSIVLKLQSLNGTLPPEFVRLPYLENIDLTRNYLNGTIPQEWGGMQRLVDISLLGNRLTGSIPKEIGNIFTLSTLTVEFNQLSGVLPLELGNLSRLVKLHLTSNNFTGELPGTLANLINLTEFRIGDNHFTGQIPDFIQNWENLSILVIQASGLDGPIPPGIARLTQLTDLRVSDLNGTEERFPPLDHIKNLKNLILRSCNIIGELPLYLGDMTDLKILDLSFNKLSGNIPISYSAIRDTDYIYLTGNLLNGPIPDWMLDNGEQIDLSYNNFTSGISEGTCQRKGINMFGIASCLGSLPCEQKSTSFHINCGGPTRFDGKTTYEDDTEPGAASKFFRRANWAFSSTGHFIDNKIDIDSYISTNTSPLHMYNADLYMNARLSPLSLTYHGFCLENGKYKVRLHFAEIRFTDDQTYRSLGRRIFDIYIQEKLVGKDFNIEEKAGGVGIEFIANFNTIVTNNTLDIRFYWAGRGTTGIPERGVYGPLISAISVDHDFRLENSRMSVATLAWILVGVASAIFLVLGILWWKCCLRHKDTMNLDLKGLDLRTGSFTLRQIKAATNNFDAANKIGEGGFGSVYLGVLLDGSKIAVKQLSSKSKQGNREFVNEIGMISALQHPHLVKLYGCCIEGNQLLLVYEYMENNSLARALFGPEESQLKLDWPTRYRICIGIARGLAYLHEESRLKIVHRDIKATNVLLDENLNPKISDFGLAKLDEEDNTHISTRIAGTYGYMAPEYAMRGVLTDKADVYSFGIVVLEIVTGRGNTIYKTKENSLYLLDWALALKEKGNLMDLVDPRLESGLNKEEVMVAIDVALLCSSVTPAVRPTMSSVVSMLEGRLVVQELVLDTSSSTNLRNISLTEILENQKQHSQVTTRSMSMEGPCTSSSTSAVDLYPVNLDTKYWEKRDAEMENTLLF